MKIPTAWIKSYLGRTISDDRLVDALSRAGIEIEDYQPANAIDKRVVVGLAKKVAQHPNADKLRVAEVSTGEHIFKVVCGAANLAEGQKVAFAQIGSTLPGGEQIREVKLRGELSQGMICSARELGLNDDHSGILVLPGDAKAGRPVAELFPAVSVVDVKTPFNRFDVLSVVGLAREVAAFTGTGLKVPDPRPLKLPAGPAVSLAAEPKFVSRFMLAEIHINKNAYADDTPKERAAWLEATGTRLISPVVDATNFVMWELGQPLHAYDADKVKGVLGVRFAKSGEKLVTLDGVERKLSKEDLVIFDDGGPVGLAGVMGGERTEVSADTKRVLLEAATFDAATVRKTAKRHGMRSEASARFERELPVQLAPVALAEAAALLGGKVTGVTDELRVWPWTQRIGLRLSKLNRLLGSELSFDEAINSLNKLGIQAERFNVAGEAKKHLGKPYVWGASFKNNGTDGFDCSYFIDYIYSLIGRPIGHTALAQFEIGHSILGEEIRVGDVLFYEGQDTGGQRDFSLDELGPNQPRSMVGAYYRYDPLTGKHVRVSAKTKKLVGHNGVYIGDGKVIDARKYIRDDKGHWQELPKDKQGVQVVPVEVYLNDPGYLGARRFVDDVDDWISVAAVPWWRPDLKLEEDLIEEIVRVIGYDRVPAALPSWRPQKLEFDRRTPQLWRLKEVLSGLGLFEVMTYSFISEDQAKMHGDPASYLKLANPLSLEQAYLRRSALPSLLGAAGRNDRYASGFGMFEITRIFEPKDSHRELPDEPLRLAILVKGQSGVYPSIKGILDALSHVFGTDLDIVPAKAPEFMPGRMADLRIGRRKVGSIGQLHPNLVDGYKIKGELAYLELDADLLLDGRPAAAKPVSKFPPVLRDLNLRLAAGKTWAEVRDAIRQTGQAEPEFVNDYYGPEVGDGRKNLAVRLVMTDPDKTLTDQEAEQRVREILAALKKKLGAELAE